MQLQKALLLLVQNSMIQHFCYKNAFGTICIFLHHSVLRIWNYRLERGFRNSWPFPWQWHGIGLFLVDHSLVGRTASTFRKSSSWVQYIFVHETTHSRLIRKIFHVLCQSYHDQWSGTYSLFCVLPHLCRFCTFSIFTFAIFCTQSILVM